MMLLRRSCLAAGAGLLATPTLVPAQSGPGRVVMGSWGGAGARMWREAFGAPFTAASKPSRRPIALMSPKPACQFPDMMRVTVAAEPVVAKSGLFTHRTSGKFSARNFS